MLVKVCSEGAGRVRVCSEGEVWVRVCSEGEGMQTSTAGESESMERR